MFHWLKPNKNSIHFRVLMLVTGLVATLLAAQLFSDTLFEVDKARKQSLQEARSLTNVVARSLEKQFDHFSLDEIEGESHLRQITPRAPMPGRGNAHRRSHPLWIIFTAVSRII